MSKKIFSAFDCIPYDFDTATGETKSFLRDDPAVLCYESAEHTRVVASETPTLAVRDLGAITVKFQPSASTAIWRPFHLHVMGLSIPAIPHARTHLPCFAMQYQRPVTDPVRQSRSFCCSSGRSACRSVTHSFSSGRGTRSSTAGRPSSRVRVPSYIQSTSPR